MEPCRDDPSLLPPLSLSFAAISSPLDVLRCGAEGARERVVGGK